jgi:hypothetical protein
MILSSAFLLHAKKLIPLHLRKRERMRRLRKQERRRREAREGRPTHHQQSHQQPKAPNPTLPKHSSSQPDLSIIMIQHHGKLLGFEITLLHSKLKVGRRL